MSLPAWASASHPIARREQTLWGRALRPWRWVWIPLALLPLCCSAVCALSALPVALTENTAETWLFALGLVLFIGVWGLQGFLGFGLNLFLSIGASTLIARERETQNWPMLRITTLHVPEIVGAKIAALLRQSRWPIGAVLAARLFAAAITTLYAGGALYVFARAPEIAADTAALTGLWVSFGASAIALTAYFIVELIAGVFYNCGVGLLASCFSRATGAAVGITFVLHFVLWFLVLTPIQQILVPLIAALSAAFPPDVSALMFVGASIVSSFLLPLAFEIGVAAAAFFIVLQVTQGISE